MLIESFFLAAESIKSNKMRSLLTMLGIIIGISSVIGILTLGDAMTANVYARMQSLGASNLIVTVKERNQVEATGPGARSSSSTAQVAIPENELLSDEVINNFKLKYDFFINEISLSKSAGIGKSEINELYANLSLNGVNEGYGILNNIEIIDGRFILYDDLFNRRNVGVISDRAAENLFPGEKNIVGKEIKVDYLNSIETFIIVGVYKFEESSMPFGNGTASTDYDIRTDLYIPLTVGELISNASKGYQNFIIMLNSDVDSEEFTEMAEEYLNEFYKNNPRYEVGISSREVVMSTAASMVGIMSTVVAIIAAISLLVGGIGVMNIMLVSVTERTKEIGVRKALGAKKGIIKTQFVVEASIICGIGGIIGIFLGFIMGYGGSLILDQPTFPSVNAIMMSFLFSVFVGIFFGFYPANKASKLNPIEALRYE